MSRIIAPVFLLIVFAASVLSLSCSNISLKECTEIGCMNIISLQTNKRIALSEPLQIDMQLDGAKKACVLSDWKNAYNDCEGVGVDLRLSDDVLTNLSIYAAPKSLTLELKQNGESLLSGNWTPSYRTETPNGPDCPPVCQVGEVTVE